MENNNPPVAFPRNNVARKSWRDDCSKPRGNVQGDIVLTEVLSRLAYGSSGCHVGTLAVAFMITRSLGQYGDRQAHLAAPVWRIRFQRLCSASQLLLVLK